MKTIVTIKNKTIEIIDSETGEVHQTDIDNLIIHIQNGIMMGFYRLDYLLEELKDYNFPKVSNRISIGKRLSKYKKVDISKYKTNF
jgi:hypothetical protein